MTGKRSVHRLITEELCRRNGEVSKKFIHLFVFEPTPVFDVGSVYSMSLNIATRKSQNFATVSM